MGRTHCFDREPWEPHRGPGPVSIQTERQQRRRNSVSELTPPPASTCGLRWRLTWTQATGKPPPLPFPFRFVVFSRFEASSFGFLGVPSGLECPCPPTHRPDAQVNQGASPMFFLSYLLLLLVPPGLDPGEFTFTDVRLPMLALSVQVPLTSEGSGGWGFWAFVGASGDYSCLLVIKAVAAELGVGPICSCFIAFSAWTG